MFEIDWSAINRRNEKLDSEFIRLAAEPCQKLATVGDRVLVAGGLIGRGHAWVRLEGLVLETADTACRVRFVGREFKGEPDETWVHNVLITDVLGKRQEAL